MPTSSQAMIVMTSDGEDPRVPRRRYTSTTDNRISVTSYDIDKAVRCTVSAVPFGNSKHGDRAESAAHVLQGTIVNDCLPQIRTGRRVAQSSTVLPRIQPHSNTTHQQNSGLERLGFRRRNVGTSGQTTLVQIKPVGPQQCRSLHRIVHESPTKQELAVHSMREAAFGEGKPVDVLKQDEPKLSLLEDIKRTVHYDSRIQPAMCVRKSLPPSNPFAVCLGFREGKDYTHGEVKDLLERHTGVKVRSVQYDPISVRYPESAADTRSRWIVHYATPTDCARVVNKGLDLGGDKIAIKLLDDVMMCEYEAYKIHAQDLYRAEIAQQLARRQNKKRSTKRRL